MRMKSFLRFTTITLLAALFACTPTHTRKGPNLNSAAEPKTSYAASVADVEAKTVAMIKREGTQARAYCSGVWVAADAFLTADHCVGMTGDEVEYITREDLATQTSVSATRFGEVYTRDFDHDLALIRAFAAPAHGTAPIGEDPEIGQRVQTMGHPLGLWWSYSTGDVAAVRYDTETWYVQSTAPISPGNSGGGLFDRSGALVGVCHAYYPRGENLNLYVHVTHVREFLKRVLGGS